MEEKKIRVQSARGNAKTAASLYELFVVIALCVRIRGFCFCNLKSNALLFIWRNAQNAKKEQMKCDMESGNGGRERGRELARRWWQWRWRRQHQRQRRKRPKSATVYKAMKVDLATGCVRRTVTAEEEIEKREEKRTDCWRLQNNHD